MPSSLAQRRASINGEPSHGLPRATIRLPPDVRSISRVHGQVMAPRHTYGHGSERVAPFRMQLQVEKSSKSAARQPIEPRSHLYTRAVSSRVARTPSSPVPLLLLLPLLLFFLRPSSRQLSRLFLRRTERRVDRSFGDGAYYLPVRLPSPSRQSSLVRRLLYLTFLDFG